MSRCRRFLVGCLVAAAVVQGGALADPVMVDSGGQTGTGWLFGSRQDGACWVVTAAHVVTRESGVQPFVWRLADGREGGIDVAFADARGDVAFGRVGGLAASECLSRLSVRNTETILRGQPRLWLLVPVSTSVRAEEVQASAFSEAAFRLDAVREDSSERIQRGVSGAPVIYWDRNGIELPVGLVTHAVPGVPGAVFATRFDWIEAFFATHEPARARPPVSDGSSIGVGYTIVGAVGRSADPANPVSALLEPTGCWSAAPVMPARALTLDIQPGSEPVREVLVHTGAPCGTQADSVHIAVQTAQGGWRTLASCTGSGGTFRCPVAAAYYPVLRITLVRRDGETVGTSAVELVAREP